MSRASLSRRESRKELRACYYYIMLLMFILYHFTTCSTGASWYLGSSWYLYATLFLCCKMLVFDRIGFSPLLWHFCSITPVYPFIDTDAYLA